MWSVGISEQYFFLSLFLSHFLSLCFSISLSRFSFSRFFSLFSSSSLAQTHYTELTSTSSASGFESYNRLKDWCLTTRLCKLQPHGQRFHFSTVDSVFTSAPWTASNGRTGNTELSTILLKCICFKSKRQKTVKAEPTLDHPLHHYINCKSVLLLTQHIDTLQSHKYDSPPTAGVGIAI